MSSSDGPKTQLRSNWALMDAHLEGAELVYTHLEGADLRFAHLEGADLKGAYLVGVDLGEAHLDEASTLPDGSKYDPEKGLEQLERFTNPEHPDFWKPKE